MSASATVEGLRAASRNHRLVVTLWLVNLALALSAAVPGWRAISDAVSRLPLFDSLREAFSFGVVADLAELRPGLVSGLGDAAAAVLGLGLLIGLLASAGSLEVLTSHDERPFAHRFGRGALRFFGRFLRLGAITLALAVALCALVAAPLFALSRYLRRESGSEWLALALFFAALLAAGLVLLLVLLLQDATRVLVVRTDARAVRKALRAGAAVVWQRPGAWLRAWAENAALLGLAFAAYLALADALPAGRFLVALVVLQQLFVLVRCGLRVALLAAEVSLVPLPAPPAEPAAQPAEPPVLPALPVEPSPGPSPGAA